MVMMMMTMMMMMMMMIVMMMMAHIHTGTHTNKCTQHLLREGRAFFCIESIEVTKPLRQWLWVLARFRESSKMYSRNSNGDDDDGGDFDDHDRHNQNEDNI